MIKSTSPIPWRPISESIPRPLASLALWTANGKVVEACRLKGHAMWQGLDGVRPKAIVTHWCYMEEFEDAVRPHDSPMLYAGTDEEPDGGDGPEK